MTDNKDCLNIFHPLIQKWFKKKLQTPTDIQEKAWFNIANNKNILITAPTGSGKTLAAFLWAINQLITGSWENGKTKVLYISPLKALNNDIQKNLIQPLNEIKKYFEVNNEKINDIKIMTRSQDTSDYERAKMKKEPPEILITTPESLNIMLSSKYGINFFKNLKTVILDEIHFVAGNKRGAYLMGAVERLTLYGADFQRIAISATIKPESLVADFIGGYYLKGKIPDYKYEKRQVVILKSKIIKKPDIKIIFPESEEYNDTDSFWHNLVKKIKEIINSCNSTLIFVNSRRLCEKLTRLINEGENKIIAYSHHGSLSHEIRLTVEEKLKNNQLKAIIATSSLELGIDIGKLDNVILIQTPSSVSSAIQKIGRSGHTIHGKSSGFLMPSHGHDMIDSLVLLKSAIELDIEEINIPESPLDVLTQTILSMALYEKKDIDELYYFIKTCRSFSNLKREYFDLIIEMLAGRYNNVRIKELGQKIIFDKIENTIKAKDGMNYLLFMSGGAITDRGYYNLKAADTGSKIGELDEEFVWERSIGDVFSFGNQIWKILKITDSDVEAVITNERLNIIPFWKAEQINRDFHLSEKILFFLKFANNNFENESFKRMLNDEYNLDEKSSNELINYLHHQKHSTNTILPDRNNIIAEHYNDPMNKSDSKLIILHTLWGNKINLPYAIALSAAWEEKYGYKLQFFTNNDAVLLQLTHYISSEEIFSLLSPLNLEKYLRKKLEQTGFFGALFRENAQRSLLLPKSSFNKRMPLWLNRLRSKKLLEAIMKFEDFPVLIETWRTALDDEFDIKNLLKIIEEIRSGEIKIIETVTDKASPFCSGLIWRQTNKYMYEDDSPLGSKSSNLSNDLIKKIIKTDYLRPSIKEEIIDIFDSKLKRTQKGLLPDNYDDLFNWVVERLLIPEDEWIELIDLMNNESAANTNEIIYKISKKIIKFRLNGSMNYIICAIENLNKIIKLYDIAFDKLEILTIDYKDLTEEINISINKIISKKEDFNNYDFLNQWLSYYGPLTKDFILKKTNIKSELLDGILNELSDSEMIIIDYITENKNIHEICTVKNLEILLRLNKKYNQIIINPVELKKLPLFLAYYQNILDQNNHDKKIENILDKLFFYPAIANAWEEVILPSRIKNYKTAMLDNLFYNNSLIWFGCGKNKISISFLEEIEIIEDITKINNYDKKILDEFFPDPNAKIDFFTLLNKVKYNSKELSLILWKLFFKKIITINSNETIRKAVINKFQPENEKPDNIISSRSGFARWKTMRPIAGFWFIIKKEKSLHDPVELEEIKKDRVRQLLNRYGVIFREILSNELPEMQWKNIFKTLRIMEFSGELYSGYFFKEIKGIQFASLEAIEILKNKFDEEKIFWINASDPASLSGIRIEGLKNELPARLISNFIVYHGFNAVMILKNNCKKIEIRKDINKNFYSDYFNIFNDLLNRNFNPFKKIVIEKINNMPANKSEYLDIFINYGFRLNFNKLELWKKY